ncbi:MAG: hypothetical protein KME26_22545 [Oscillatoria princeps RMCB-10]|nr:hypothetical protein [Oscillatoria princeps RMCB-10]
MSVKTIIILRWQFFTQSARPSARGAFCSGICKGKLENQLLTGADGWAVRLRHPPSRHGSQGSGRSP